MPAYRHFVIARGQHWRSHVVRSFVSKPIKRALTRLWIGGRRPAAAHLGTASTEAGRHWQDEAFQGNDFSDVTVATIEPTVQAHFNDTVSAQVRLLFEEDTTEHIEVDRATITVAPPDSPFNLTAGRYYVPFGSYQTAFIDDTLALEIGETRETTLRAGVGANGFDLGVWAFNGDSGDDSVSELGANAGYHHDGAHWAVDIGLGVSSNLADSDVLRVTVIDVDSLDNSVTGLATHARLEAEQWAFTGEYVSALDAFEANELAFDGDGAQPAGWQLEIARELKVMDTPVTAALGWQGTDEALAVGLPAQRWLAGLTVTPWTATDVSLQLPRDRDYDASEGGTGEHAHSATVQLAVSF